MTLIFLLVFIIGCKKCFVKNGVFEKYKITIFINAYIIESLIIIIIPLNSTVTSYFTDDLSSVEQILLNLPIYL